MKIYTKTGDSGYTALLGGTRVMKNHKRIEAYGTVDELIASLGIVRDHLEGQKLIEDIIKIQDQLMVCSAILAAEPDAESINIPKLSEEVIVWLEDKIDEMENQLPPLKHFLFPGGHPAVSFTHFARTVCRRAERRIISLSENEMVPKEIIVFFNRLSDYLFVLSRFISNEFKAIEITWQPKVG